MREIILVVNNIRSTHNVGAFFRTCDGLGVREIIFSGYTPYPSFQGDTRLPHFADKITRQIHKTALGAESHVYFKYSQLESIFTELKKRDAILIGLEQATDSITPEDCKTILEKTYPSRPAALFIGNEIHGVDKDILKKMDLIIEIPMQGSKESLNVSVATAIALYILTL
jgi:23S rRNA (guanosine2251-2'-O)-methyltransferase